MKKVGIATMTGGQNYGNALQNYAVQEIIRGIGYEPYTLRNLTVDGFPDNAREPIPLRKKLMPAYVHAYALTRLNRKYGCKNNRDCYGKGLRNAKRNLAEYKNARNKRVEKFKQFVDCHLQFDTVAFDSNHFPTDHFASFYAFVCGSDQIWNPYFYTNSMIEFLQHAPEHKRIAFAPSFGISEVPEVRCHDYAQWISAIPHLSVREEAGAELIKHLTGREALVLLDPTFGLTSDQWRQFAKKPDAAPKGKYVFCYFLGNEIGQYSKWIRTYANRNDCEIVEMFDIHSLQYYDIDPCEFVWLLANAEAVFTDSFHGTAFSINMQVPFVVFERQEGGASMSSRISTLLMKTGLSNRVFPSVKMDAVRTIDFSNAERSVISERKIMVDYLTDALRKVGDDTLPLLANRYHCSGCGVCANACPVGAISMTRDREGFSYPAIDKTKCVRCGACENVCPANRLKPVTSCGPEAFFAYAKNVETVQNSSSGGVFSELCKEILNRGGLVYGVGFDEKFHVCHQCITTHEDIPHLRTSKYTQSDARGVYTSVKAALTQEKTVLFTGTPCQVAALKRYLKKDYQNLYTADIICHGVPSPLVWEKYLQQIHGDKAISKISFRDKTQGWNNFSMRVEYRDGECYRELATKDPYVAAFLENLTLRPSCYQCQFKTLDRFSDLTLADYWGVEVVHPQLKQQQGVSLVLLHTEKGKALFSKISEHLVCGVTDRERAITMNHAALHSVQWPIKRNVFFDRFEKEPLTNLIRSCLRQPFRKQVRRVIVISGSRVKRLLRRLIRR